MERLQRAGPCSFSGHLAPHRVNLTEISTTDSADLLVAKQSNVAPSPALALLPSHSNLRSSLLQAQLQDMQGNAAAAHLQRQNAPVCLSRRLRPWIWFPTRKDSSCLHLASAFSIDRPAPHRVFFLPFLIPSLGAPSSLKSAKQCLLSLDSVRHSTIYMHLDKLHNLRHHVRHFPVLPIH